MVYCKGRSEQGNDFSSGLQQVCRNSCSSPSSCNLNTFKHLWTELESSLIKQFVLLRDMICSSGRCWPLRSSDSDLRSRQTSMKHTTETLLCRQPVIPDWIRSDHVVCLFITGGKRVIWGRRRVIRILMLLVFLLCFGFVGPGLTSLSDQISYQMNVRFFFFFFSFHCQRSF